MFTSGEAGGLFRAVLCICEEGEAGAGGVVGEGGD